MPWTEKVVKPLADAVSARVHRSADQLLEVEQSGFAAVGEQVNATNVVASLGIKFQETVRQNPMEHVNRTPRAFAQWCKQQYEQVQLGQAPREFSVLLLAADPLHFDASRSLRTSQRTDQAKQFFGQARVVRLSTENGFLFTLQVQVLGARVSELLGPDFQHLSLAAATTTRRTATHETLTGLSGACQGSEIQSTGDIAHLAPLLTVADELMHTHGTALLQLVSSAQQKSVQTIADVAHTHGLNQVAAHRLGTEFFAGSTALNPITASEEGTFIVHPNLTDQVVIVPIWEELTAPQENLDQDPAADAATASVLLGVAATFEPRELDSLGSSILRANSGQSVPLATFSGSAR